ncbi:HIT family protein [Candidatus Woesearchaeota archaeon]|nr:HIT family protein [Candidatus Woesearchaeota archaeon]
MELQNLTPEEQKAMQEKLKNMSPEELRNLQKQQCLFCQIISGKVNARRVYDDDKVVAVLDINPASLGHVLLIPREHYQILPQMPDDEIAHLFNIAKGISGAVLRAFQVQGTTIFVANGVAAGQKATHVMVHIIPRHEGDKAALDIPEYQINEENMKVIHKRLLDLMTADLGMMPENEASQAGPESETQPAEAAETPAAPESVQPPKTPEPEQQPTAQPIAKSAPQSQTQKPRNRKGLDDLTGGF